MTREDLQPYFKLTGGVAILVVISLVLYSLFGTSSSAARQAARDPQAFYTDDDGKTLFTDVSSRIPPFDHNGKPAVAAIVTSPDNGKTKTIAYLQRYNEKTHKLLTAGNKAPRNSGLEVKKPNSPTWVPLNSKQGIDILRSTTGTPITP